MSKPNIRAFFDEATFTVTYVVSDPDTGHAAVIDPVLDFDPVSGRTSTGSADDVIAYVEDGDLAVDWILETHVHADHLSGAPYIKHRLGGTTGIGADVSAVQESFKSVFNLKDLAADIDYTAPSLLFHFTYNRLSKQKGADYKEVYHGMIVL